MTQTPQSPRSTAMGELIGASSGMLLGTLLGSWFFSVVAPFGLIVMVLAAILAVALFTVLMIGGSIIGNWLWGLLTSR